MKKIMFLVMMLSLILIGCADKKEEAKTETDNTNTELSIYPGSQNAIVACNRQ